MFGYLTPVYTDAYKHIGEVIKEVCTVKVLQGLAVTALKPFVVENSLENPDIFPAGYSASLAAEEILKQENKNHE